MANIEYGTLVCVKVETTGSQGVVAPNPENRREMTFQLLPETTGTVLEVSEDGTRVRIFCLNGAIWIDASSLEEPVT